MSIRLIGILLISIGLMFAGFAWYYNDTQERIATLTENNSKLDLAVTMQEETIAGLQSEYSAATQELQRINDAYTQIRRQNQLLANKLARHDLGYLAFNKPGLVENIVNNASTKAGRCFELLSGAELTEDEQNAQTANEFNSECPWLWVDSTNP